MWLKWLLWPITLLRLELLLLKLWYVAWLMGCFLRCLLSLWPITLLRLELLLLKLWYVAWLMGCFLRCLLSLYSLRPLRSAAVEGWGRCQMNGLLTLGLRVLR